MGDLEESLSQSHSSGSFVHSCLPEVGLPGCPCRAPLLATSHLWAARCPGQVSRGRLVLVWRQGAAVVCWCTRALLHGARLRWCMRQ